MSIQIVCGVEQVKKSPLQPYSDLVCSFLDVFAAKLRKDEEARSYPDVQTFAFWARKSNIQKKKREFERRVDASNCIGRGIVFHIAPSNVPVNSMFTYAFGLLAGNANIVRIPTKRFPQVECMCRVLEQCLRREEFQKIYEMTSVVRYERNKAITDSYSESCNVRVIWGGDETIRDIRTSGLPPRSTEITFADRYSFGIVDAVKWKNADEKEQRTLAEGFYNDTYLMDQNACSTPHLICWKLRGMSQEEWETVQESFWKEILKAAGKYDLADIKVSEKYTALCERALQEESVARIKRYGNLLYVCDLQRLEEKHITDIRGRYGMFFQYPLKSIEELNVFSNEKVQTCAYYGIDGGQLTEYITSNSFSGIDRIVPFGKTLDIDVIWDGYDLIAQMSRIIVTES